MPSKALKSMAEKHGVSLKTAERYWDEAKKSASKGGHKDDYAYIMGIVKHRMGAALIEGMVVARLCILGGFVEAEAFDETETAAPKVANTPKRAPYKGAERRLNKVPKVALKIFSTDNPFNVPGLVYAEFEGSGIEHAAYDKASTSLWISFAGQHLNRWYFYKDVPPETWNSFRKSSNATVAFNKNIRPIHDYALIENS